MIIRSISAENFGKFDRYTVNLDDTINVFYGDNEAGKTTLYEIISILLFAPSNDAEMAESNKLIKTDEKYARVYAIINIDDKEISIAREIYVNNTNLSIADQDNVSSLGNVNVPFIGNLTKEMYESFHTIDYYNMATITNNVWQQIVKMIEGSQGAPRVTPDYSSPETEGEEKEQKKSATFEDQIKQREEEKKELESKLKLAKKAQKKMIKSQDKIDDLLNDLEDVENNIELESSYLREAEKMNQIRDNIKKTQDLTLEFEKYKDLQEWMPNLKAYYERLKLYSENIENGIENPIDMFDDLEVAAQETAEEDTEKSSSEETEENADIEEIEEINEQEEALEELEAEADEIEETAEPEVEKQEEPAKELSFEEKLKKFKLRQQAAEKEETAEKAAEPEQEKGLAKDKISEYIEKSYLNYEHSKNIKADDPYADDDEIEPKKQEKLNLDFVLDIEKLAAENKATEEKKQEVRPLEIRKPKDTADETDGAENMRSENVFGQRNPYADSIFPNMDDVNYSDEGLSKEDAEQDEENEKDKYSSADSNDLPIQSKQVNQKDMNEKEENQLLKVEQFLNNIDMAEIIAASKETVEVDSAAQEEIDKAKLRYEIIAKRVFKKDMDMTDLSDRLKKLDTNAIYKSIVKYKSLSQKQRKVEQVATGAIKQPKKSSANGETIAFGVIAFISLIIGLACFFIDQVMLYLPNNIDFLNKVIDTMKNGLLLKDYVSGNIIAGGAFTLISILLTIATILGKDEDRGQPVQVIEEEVKLDELKNQIRNAKREVIDTLKEFPLPAEYLENPNNSIISVINELREAEEAYSDIILESTMPKNKNYRAIWKVAKKHLSKDELSDDLFDNISKLRRKIQDYKEEEAEKEKKLKDAKMRINMISGNSGLSNKPKDDDDDPLKGLSGFASTNNSVGNMSGNAASSNSFGLPQTQSDNLGVQNNQMSNAAEKQSFGLPGTAEQEYTGSEFTTKQDTSYPGDTANQFGTTKDISYPGDSGSTFGTSQDNSYPGDTANQFGTTKDISYPGDSGSTFGTSQDNSYPGDTANQFGTTKDTSYPGDSGSTFGTSQDTSYPGDSGSTFGTSQDTSYPGDTANQFGTTKDTSYPGDSGNSFGTTQDNDYPTNNGLFNSAGDQNSTDETTSFDLSSSSTDKQDENDFGIPGIKRYGSNAGETQADSMQPNDDSGFGIPGINKYGADEPKEKVDINDSSFDIPGVVRYSNDAPAAENESQQFSQFGSTDQAQETPEISSGTKFNDFGQSQNENAAETEEKGFGLPGLDKFSNRGETGAKGFEEKKSDEIDIPPVVPPISGMAEAGAAAAAGAAGAAMSSGLPGLDKFSNRGDAAKPIETPVEEDTVEQADDFGIPGIHRYSTQEQKTETQFFTPVSDNMADNKFDEEKEEPAEEIKEAAEETVQPVEPIEEEKPERVKDRRELEYERLLELLGEDPESTIRNVEDISRELHREIIKRDKAMADLLKLNDAAVRLSTLSSNKWPYKEKAVEASRERIDYLEADKLKLTRHLEMLTGKIEDIPYEDTPQAISDRIKSLDEEIAQLKLESDKHAIAEEILEKEKTKMFDMSSSADRSHIIEDTSVYMKELTLGKYVRAKINDEQTGLAICDKDGQWFDTTKDRLSQATREQLYLALRISIADLFDEKSLIFPMFFDEALITWDKRRMRAVMRLLSKMSMHRQVIIFTCHDWLKDMISEYLIGAKIIMM